MLNKDTLIKIAVALLVIAIVWFILKARKKRSHAKKHHKTIVTAMPIVEKYDDADDDAVEEEGFASWNGEDDAREDFEDVSPVEFRSELLE